jgi:hypothetical protein
MIPQKKVKFRKLTPSTELQTLAQKENFALFTLTGMLGNLVHLRKVNSEDANRLEFYVKQSIARIKSRQNSRKVKSNG